jgi:hypothetical protein
MVVADFHVMGVLSLPSKADAPLVIDTDRVLSSSVSSERLQPITGWHSKIVQRARSIQLHELPQGNAFDRGRKSVGAFASPKALRSAARETRDHDVIVSQGDTPSISPRTQPPEPLRIRAGDERLVVGPQLVDGMPELLSDVDGVSGRLLGFLGAKAWAEWHMGRLWRSRPERGRFVPVSRSRFVPVAEAVMTEPAIDGFVGGR